jgi:hypothetical protein
VLADEPELMDEVNEAASVERDPLSAMREAHPVLHACTIAGMNRQPRTRAAAP